MTAPGMALGLTAPFTGSQAGCTDLTTSRLGSGCTVTVSAQPLFVSSISAAAVSGSAVQTPPLFGFTSEPSAVGVTVTHHANPAILHYCSGAGAAGCGATGRPGRRFRFLSYSRAVEQSPTGRAVRGWSAAGSTGARDRPGYPANRGRPRWPRR